MKIKELYEGMIFNITDENQTVTQGKIIGLDSAKTSKLWYIQFDDELETFTWGNDDDELPASFEYVGQFNPNQDRR